MSRLSKWVASWFSASDPSRDEDLARFDITYQWSYEPRGYGHKAEAESVPRLSISPNGHLPPHISDRVSGAGNEGIVVEPDEAAHEHRSEQAGADPVKPAPTGAGMPPQRVAADRYIPYTHNWHALAGYIRRYVETDEERWWLTGRLPSREVLRGALELLSAGYTLDLSQLSLLLRTALHYRRGVLTALRHQTDTELTALLMCESIADSKPAFPADLLAAAVNEDVAAHAWKPLLTRELQTAYLAAGDQYVRSNIETALKVLATGSAQTPIRAEPVVMHERVLPVGWMVVAVAALCMVLAFVAGAAWFLLYGRTADMVSMTILGNGADTRTGEMSTIWMDRTEVTNSAYRRCYRAGDCPWPADTKAAGIDDYLREPAYAEHPVVNVDEGAAASYCSWDGKRLPTAAEWRSAAAISPVTGRAYRFPWGDSFSRTLANSRETGIGRPQQVGSYRPAGDSSTGISDMAGNVAEWTSTPGTEPGTFVVVGGSYRDPAESLAVGAQTVMSGTVATDWIGIRCVRSQP